MKTKILVKTADGRAFDIPADHDANLAQTLFSHGAWPNTPLCSGLGRCGLCRVRYLSEPPVPLGPELKKISKEELAQGWRLSCMHQADPVEIFIPENILSAPPVTEIIDHAHGPYSLALDLGTTSIHWSALRRGRVVARGRELNPQIGLGGEIMSRLAYSARPGGGRQLRQLILDRLKTLVKWLNSEIGGPFESLTIAGNPAMTYILLGLDAKGISQAPYHLDYAGDSSEGLLPDLPPAYFPPLLAPFVGADLSAGLAALRWGGDTGPAYPYVLADMGTNGEFVLALSEDEYIAASVPMGPALEGVGLKMGRTAGPGAATSFRLTPNGIAALYYDDTGPDKKLPGISGTGYLSLTALLLQNGLLDKSGRFAAGASPLAEKLARNITSQGGEPLMELADGLRLPASDIEEILKVKAAFNLALSALLSEAGLERGGLAAIYIAGAMGEHANTDDLERLGFLPPGSASRTVKAGNTSLKGSELLLENAKTRQWIKGLAARTRVLDLASDSGFGKQYLERMIFEYVP